MFFDQRIVNGLAVHSYVIGDEKSKKCAVIDPLRDVEYYLNIAEKNGFEITDILETHVHADYVCGSLELKERLKGLPVIHSSGMGGDEWTPKYADHVVKDGDKVNFDGFRLQAVHTPGHTPEHLIWLLYDLSDKDDKPCWIFTGDLLFVGDVGRPDLLGDEEVQLLSKQLYQSVFNKLSQFPDSCEIFPGHGAGSLCGKAIGSRPSSTLGRERESNPSFKQIAESEWIAQLMNKMPLAPPYFPVMKQINREGPPVIGDRFHSLQPLNPQDVNAVMAEGGVVLDVRSKEAFSSAHIPGAINLPFSPSFSSWAGWVIPYGKPIVLIYEDFEDHQEVVTSLIRVGFDQIQGFLEGGIRSWEEKGFMISHISIITVDELVEQLRTDPPYLLDVRTDTEWEEGHIDGAHHLFAGIVKDHVDQIPKDRPIALICGSGYRASMVASLLKQKGYEDVINVAGGMNAWREKQQPVR